MALPAGRPPGLRTRVETRTWWRLDASPPSAWAWTPFPTPVHRFDPASGAFRVRYAADEAITAARERFPERAIDEEHGELWLVELAGRVTTLPLTWQANLDVLGLDERVSTGRLDARDLAGGADPLLATCWALADAVDRWWDGTPPALTYRARRRAGHRSIAFRDHHGLVAGRSGRLRDAHDLLVRLVVHHGFRVPPSWL